MLSRIVDWYNEIKQKVVPCEFDIIKEELDLIDNKLLIALETAKWSDYEEIYIKDLHGDLQNLNERVLKTKENINRIITSLRSWGDIPMYQRKNGQPNELMNVEGFADDIANRQSDVTKTKELILDIVDENFRLFFNLPLKKPKLKKRESSGRKSFLESIETLKNLELERISGTSASERPSESAVAETDKAAQASSSEITLRPISGTYSTLSFESNEIIKTEAQLKLYRAYEEHLDKLILKQIQNALRVSLVYIKIEMENRMKKVDSPLFEVKLELQANRLVFNPRMDNNFKQLKGFLHIITSMVANILNMTEMIQVIAQPLDPTEAESGPLTFRYYLESYARREFADRDFDDIENIQLDITAMAREGIRDALFFAKRFEKYNFLWTTDKKRHLEEFLTYGRKLTKEEQEKIENGTSELSRHQPDLNDFKNMIEYYDKLYNEIDKIDAKYNLNSFLRVNLTGLKFGLLNLVCKWSYLFKQYLTSKVIDDLDELENFIDKSSELLEQTPTNDDYDLLLKILKTLSSVYEREKRTDGMFDPLKKIMDLLKTYDVKFEKRVSDQFAVLPERWITLKKQCALVKQNIQSVQAYQVDLIKKRIMMFDLRTRLYHEKFLKLPVSLVSC